MSHGGRARSANQCIAPHLLRRLRALHDGLARDLGPAFAALLRAPCTAIVAGMETATYDRFVSSVESPACFYLLEAEPAVGKGTVPEQPSTGARRNGPEAGADAQRWSSHKWGLSPVRPGNERLMLDIEPALLHSMIDRMLGGNGGDPAPGRPMTEIELCVAARVVRRFLDECGCVWQGVLDFTPDELQAESDPRLLRVFPADEAMFIVSLELDVGEVRGLMRLCMPTRLIERVGDKLSDGAARSAAPSALDGSVEVAVTLATTTIAGRELNDLCVGDIITTETPVASPAIVSLAGNDKFHGKPGLYQGRKAVVILEEPGGSPTAERP